MKHRKRLWTLSLGAGPVVPSLLIIAAAVAAAAGVFGETGRWLYLVAGLLILVGGTVQRTALILQANAMRAVSAGGLQRVGYGLDD